MGAIFRIKTWYTNLKAFLSGASKSQIPVYGTFYDGNNIYKESLTQIGIMFWNEGNEYRTR